MKKIKNICCIGAGYVGGPTIAVFAEKCPNINFTVVDIDKERIGAWNSNLDSLPIFEPGLKEIISNVRDKNLFFSNDIDDAINKSEIIFIAVNTPPLKEGPGKGFGADLKYIIKCAEHIANISKTDKIIVEKSTVPIKTAKKLDEIFKNINSSCNFEILSNPEFLAEGTAVQDLRYPDRVLIGGKNSKSGKEAVNTLVDLYLNWVPKKKILTTNVWSSELSKLASNAMLAQRISSINSFSALCDKTGADIIEVSEAIGLDHRIGKHFLRPSVGFGGSCFQKDILNLVYLCKTYGLDEVAEYWHQVIKINDYQKLRLINKVVEKLGGNIQNKKITIYGWSFKKNTNDSRESASIKITYELLKKGAFIRVYDPKSSYKIISRDLLEISKNNLDILQNIDFVNEPYDAAKESECICILTEWDEFLDLNWSIIINNMINHKIVIDGRYILKDTLDSNVVYL